MAKLLLEGKRIALNAFIRKQRRRKITNDLAFHQGLEKEQQNQERLMYLHLICRIKLKVTEIESKEVNLLNIINSWFFKQPIQWMNLWQF